MCQRKMLASMDSIRLRQNCPTVATELDMTRSAEMMRSWTTLPVRHAHLDVAIRDRTVVGLDHERAFRQLRALPAVAGRRQQLLVLVDDLAVERHARQLRVGDLLGFIIEA